MSTAQELRIFPISLKNILFAMDFTPGSLLAFPFAVGIAGRYGGKLYVAHIVPAEDYDAVPATWLAALEKIEIAMEESLISPLGNLREIPHEVIFDHGSIRSKLLATADKCEIDLIVVATHGWRGMKKLLKGSTAEEIAYLAARPVLTVGPKVSRRADFKHILYASDFSRSAMCALPHALSLAKTYDADLLLHINGWNNDGPVLDAVSEIFQAFREQLQKYGYQPARETLESFSQQLCRYGYESFREELPNSTNEGPVEYVDVVVDFGPRDERILAHAENRGSDLIVIGVPCRESMTARIAAHLPGSMVYDVISQANCPVLTVPIIKSEQG